MWRKIIFFLNKVQWDKLDFKLQAFPKCSNKRNIWGVLQRHSRNGFLPHILFYTKTTLNQTIKYVIKSLPKQKNHKITIVFQYKHVFKYVIISNQRLPWFDTLENLMFFKCKHEYLFRKRFVEINFLQCFEKSKWRPL